MLKTLGHDLTKGVSGYTVTETKDHKIILEPQVEISAREKWLFENKTALKRVQRGLKEAAEGKLSTKGSFAKFSDDEIE